MILIENVLIDDAIAKSNFSCELNGCKGACCTFPGEYGAPLKQEEIELINQSKNAAREYLSEKSKKVLDTEGFAKEIDGELFTVCIEKKDCVFVYYEGQIAKCALEKAYYDGKTKWKKPLSCHLFPIRVGNFAGKYLYYEKIKECNPGVANGNAQNIKLYKYLKEPLTRAYGASWYKKLEDKLEKE